MSLFGWCATGHHDGCRVEYENWVAKGQMIRCECECHGQRESEGPDTEADLSSGEDGRAEQDNSDSDVGPNPVKSKNPRRVPKQSTSDD
jgi:hypothetical protein